MVLLVVGAFALGRATAGTVSSPDTPQSGTRPGATASATEGAPKASSSLPAPGPYNGPKAPLRISDASAACTARGAHHAYSARNVLDRDPRTAWRCDGRAVGQQLVLSLPHHSEVVSVGLMQGSGKQSALTRVAWIFDNGTRVFQTLSGRGEDHTLQQLQIVPMVTDSVKLRILGTAGGPSKGASISTVRLDVSARGSD